MKLAAWKARRPLAGEQRAKEQKEGNVDVDRDVITRGLWAVGRSLVLL